MTRLWTPAQYLALRVLEIALLDAHAGDAAARRFVESEGPGLTFWCRLLNVSPARIRLAATDPQWPGRYARVKAELAGSHLAPGPGRPKPAASPLTVLASPGPDWQNSRAVTLPPEAHTLTPSPQAPE